MLYSGCLEGAKKINCGCSASAKNLLGVLKHLGTCGVSVNVYLRCAYIILRVYIYICRYTWTFLKTIPVLPKPAWFERNTELFLRVYYTASSVVGTKNIIDFNNHITRRTIWWFEAATYGTKQQFRCFSVPYPHTQSHPLTQESMWPGTDRSNRWQYIAHLSRLPTPRISQLRNRFRSFLHRGFLTLNQWTKPGVNGSKVAGSKGHWVKTLNSNWSSPCKKQGTRTSKLTGNA